MEIDFFFLRRTVGLFLMLIWSGGGEHRTKCMLAQQVRTRQHTPLTPAR